MKPTPIVHPKTDHKVFLICRQSDGAPTMFPCIVNCTELDFSETNHLDLVCEAAEEEGYEVSETIPFLCDESDPLGKMLDYVPDWDSVKKIQM